MREAIEFHVEGLRHEGYSVPSPSSYSTYIDVPVLTRGFKTDVKNARLKARFIRRGLAA